MILYAGICRLKIWVPFFFGDIQENGTPALGEWSITSDMRSITHYLNLRPKSTSSRQPKISEVPQIEVAFDLDSNGVRNLELLAWVRNLPGNLVTF